MLTVALARGVGWLTEAERADLLMQDAPDDLFAEACKQLSRAADDPEIADIAARLRAPLHPNCYLSPTQFAKKFWLARPTRAAEGAASAGIADAGTSEVPLQDAETDVSDAKPPAPAKPEAAWPPGKRRLLGAALIILLLAFALWAATLALPG